MSGKDIPRLVVRRTPEIEGLLQDVWQLQPNIADKYKLTIYLSLGALVRELRGISTLPSVMAEESTMTTYAMEIQPTESADIQKLLAEESASSQAADNVSDDVEWD